MSKACRDEQYRKKAENEILKEMQSHRLKLGALFDISLTGTMAGIAYSSGGMAVPCVAAVALGLIACNNIAKVIAAGRRNRKLVSALNNEEQGTIEEMLRKEKERYRQLIDAQRGALNAVKSVEESVRAWNEKPLEEQLRILAGEVNSLLSCDIPVPKIMCSAKPKARSEGDYSPWKRIIRLSENGYACLTMAHEYCHYTEHIKAAAGWEWRNSPFMQEGFAESLAVAAVENYAARNEDMGMLADVVREKIGILGGYRGIFRFEYILRLEGSREIARYCAGPIAFLVAEQKHGRGIYRELLDSKEPHQLLTDMVCEREA